MPLLQPQPEIITLETYETFPEDRRVEVFDGVVYDMASPPQIHQAISMQLSTIIKLFPQAIRQMTISASSTTTRSMAFVNIGSWTQNEKPLP